MLLYDISPHLLRLPVLKTPVLLLLPEGILAQKRNFTGTKLAKKKKKYTKV